ncbi:tetratricopeptide repeat protein [Brevundimonas sp.]|uniref:tetratricopeptide repeat protein n=1 Tax=Brevundimonas sp. TaxID=1871086 RepID=UPI00391D82B3
MNSTNLTGVYLDDRGGDVLFVTFSHRNWTPASGKEYWGKEPLAKLGVSTLGLIARTRHWYPEDDTRSLLDGIAGTGLFRNRRIITYGTSMGGYGAVKYASQIGAEVALAIVPQWSIDPAEVGHVDPRYVSSFVPELHRDMRITAGDMAKETHVIYDPLFPMDRFHFERLAQSGAAVRPVVATGQGHAPGFVLAEGRQGGALLRAYAHGAPEPWRDARNALRAARPGSFSYFQSMAKTLRSAGQPGKAVRYLDEALRLRPDSARAHCQRAACLARIHHFDEAAEALDRAEVFATAPELARIADLRGGMARMMKKAALRGQ